MLRTTLGLIAAGLLLGGCGDSEGTDASAGDDGGPRVDAGGGGMDGGGMDAGEGADGGPGDDGGSAADAGGPGFDSGPRPDGATPCTDDSQCTSGMEWCEAGVCVPCDNGGLLCDIACAPDGWSTYERNGCFPCDCAPPSECTSDADCAGMGGTCYAGRFCWCSPRDPSCCRGNFCSQAGCTTPNPAGCRRYGCPRGQSCGLSVGVCEPSSCSCDGSSGTWGCTEDCGGGVCM